MKNLVTILIGLHLDAATPKGGASRSRRATMSKGLEIPARESIRGSPGRTRPTFWVAVLRWTHLFGLTLACVASASSAGAGFAFFEPVQPPRPYQVMVHRGAAGQTPENTRAALQHCIEDALEWAEVDLRLTQD